MLNHTPNGSLALVLVEALVEAAPPLKEHALANKLEPRREQQRVVLEHGFELVFGDVLGGLYFVGVLFEIDVGLDEEDVINWRAISRRALDAIRSMDILSCSPHLPSLGAT